MSQRLISLSPDLKRLRDEGYDIEVRGSYLLVRSVPYVTSTNEVAYGTLVSQLSLAGDKTVLPETHVAYFIGEYPCDVDGAPLEKIGSAGRIELDKGLVVDCTFSSKPASGYKDYYEKLTTYATILSSPARALEVSATPRCFPGVADDEPDSPFAYLDTASSRAEIMATSRKLELSRLAIVGVGGTGSYILDLVAKTRVREIHLFDGDVFSQHNAFRSPSAPSIEALQKRPLKVHYLRDLYSPMHEGIVAHPYHLDSSNAHELADMAFVFLSLDAGTDKRAIHGALEAHDIPFIDVGMGIDHTEGSLGGILRITTATVEKRDHLAQRVPSAAAQDGDYARNIQVADLNALNAAFAVIRWKKLFGFYRDLGREHNTNYTIDGNHLLNEDQP